MSYKEERKKDAEIGHIHELISRKSIVTKADKKPYVFISYSSKDWQKVLYEIVYELCKKKGLRVYFDTKFDVGSDSWLKQFQQNMSDENCRAVLAFISPNYKTSYATLMELMSARESKDTAQTTVLPIYIGNADCNDYNNTGLGTRRFPDYSTNDLWDKELILFNKLFNNLMIKNNNTISDKESAKGIYPHYNKDIISYDSELDKDLVFENEDYWKDKYILKDDIDEKNRYWKKLTDDDKSEKGEKYLNKKSNADLISMILSGIDKNNIDGVNKSITDAVYAKLNDLGYGDVFDKDLVEVESVDYSKYNVDIVNDENKNPIQVKNEEFVSNTDEVWDLSNSVHRDIEIGVEQENVSDTDSVPVEGYQYAIFGKEYSVGAREQGKLMFDTFEALVKRYPEYVDLLTQRTSIARAENVKNANTAEADPTYFRGCKEFEVNGHKYLVGTSYGFKAKIAEIKGMFKICGADLSEFVLNGEPLESNQPKGGKSGNKAVKNDNIFEYELWGIAHTANKMVDMLNDVFDLIAEKYPERIQNIAESDNITAVARKADLVQGTANVSKIKQFSNFKGKEHSVNGDVYCVNAGYNRAGCIKQIERMLILCDENSNVFKITKEPEKSTRSVTKSGKEGLGEMLD